MSTNGKMISFLLAMLILVAILAIASVAVLGKYAYEKGLKDGAMQALDETPERLLEGQERMYNMCIDWLMESDIKEAQRRICDMKK